MKNRKVTVFWKYFQLMVCIVVLAVFMLLLSMEQSQKMITENYLVQAGENLAYNSERLSHNIYAVSTLPETIEDTNYYDYLRACRGGELPAKFHPVLPFICNVLSKQLYLLGDTEECVLYMSGVNSICTRKKGFAVAEECFEQYLNFETVGKDVLLQELKSSNNYKLLPMQAIAIGDKAPIQALAYISHNAGISIGVMAIYSQDYFLSGLGMDALPENTYLQIESNTGELLMEYPQGISDELEQRSYLLTGEMKELRAQVKLWIPKTYFEEQTAEAHLSSMVLIVLMILLGLVLCLVFSKMAAAPIRRLARVHAGELQQEKMGDELLFIESAMEASGKKLTNLQRMLRMNRWTQAFSGNVLSEKDEELLREDCAEVPTPYRIAILHAKELDQALVEEELRLTLKDGFRSVVINIKEIGILFHGDMEETAALQASFRQMADEYRVEGKTLYCGISGTFESLTQMNVAVRQARFSLSRKETTVVFSAPAIRGKEMGWLYHERLYQAILANDEEVAVKLLHKIIAETEWGVDAKEEFYAIGFMLRSAAAELNLFLQELSHMEYDSTQLPWENMERLGDYIHILFLCIREKQAKGNEGLQEEVLSWIRRNFSDSELCATVVAEQFGIPEKLFHSMVKQATGVSFSEYLLSLRMRKAAHLLCSTKWSVIEVAQQCGYQAESTFYRVFKKYYNQTPQNYRQGEK